MFALVFRFPHGRYHATPWGRHVNEGAVAWPPEPYRILRALIATWHRKADQARFPEAALCRLIDALAEREPSYKLPAAVHAHTRHYMPQAKPGDTKLVFDAFYRVDPEDELIVGWPNPALKQGEVDPGLDEDVFALAAHLAERIGYLGRAESVTTAEARNDHQGTLPVKPDKSEPAAGHVLVDALAPLTPVDYAAARPGLLALNTDRPNSARRILFEATIPTALTDALQVETSDLQTAGWSRPPAGRLVTYAAPEVGPRPPSGAVAQARDTPDKDQPTVARLILAGRPRPPITDAVKLGEVFRRALMAHVGGVSPSVLSGRDVDGRPLRDPEHTHCFFLPEDHDQDGFIDHLLLYAKDGIPRVVRRALESLRALYIDKGARKDPDEDGADGRREWRVALEGYGEPKDFNDSALLACSRTWVSATPYLRPRHLKGDDAWGETVRMVQGECLKRELGTPEVELLASSRQGREIEIKEGSWKNALAFHRFRSRRGLVQPDRTGTALRLTFAQPITGPVALGFGAHFGLGLFRAKD